MHHIDLYGLFIIFDPSLHSCAVFPELQSHVVYYHLLIPDLDC